MDNFEWADGLGTAFRADLRRLCHPATHAEELSASFYREVAARNRLA